MFETLKRLYEEKRLNPDSLKKAVTKNWITIEQYTEISGEPYTA